MIQNYDVIIIGAGSIGIPTGLALTNSGMKILIIDRNTSPGQENNKRAIGGIRATHSEPAKILIGKRSLEIFSTWESIYNTKIDWIKSGYLFPIYRNKEKKLLTSLLPIQKKLGLEIDFIKVNKIKKIVPHIAKKNLIGGIYSPNDGSASPLLTINSFSKELIRNGAKLNFNETVTELIISKNKIKGLITNKRKYFAPIIIDAMGISSRNFNKKFKINIPVYADLHEAGITEPIKNFFKCMIVDIRSDFGSKNFYFYQNNHGQIIFCITPNPPILESNCHETSIFLPQSSRKLINLIPSLSSLRIRRTWRGNYPMTPDGSPIIGWNKKIKGLFHATGMCGQGFMLGPGIAEFISRLINKNYNENDNIIRKTFSPYRKWFQKEEALK